METSKPEHKKEQTALYIVYAAAAYFGLQYLLKPKRAASATVVPQQTTEATLVTIDTNSPSTTSSFPAASTPAGKVTTWIAESFPIRKGMKGPMVKALQQKLGVATDGAFGNDTEAALLRRYGVSSVSQTEYRTILSQTAATDSGAVLKQGSRGGDVYRLQKWLGFKDKRLAKKGEPVADSIFGAQTLAALQRKTGKTTISLSQLNTLTKQLAGMGYAGELVVTKRATVVLDANLLPYRSVPCNTILGTRMMELSNPQQQKAYTQFKTVDGFHRWVEKDAV